MTIKKLNYFMGILLGIAAVILISSLSDLSESEQIIKDAQGNRDIALLLADELQESSQNLTSAIQKFVVMGNERYASEYMDIMMVRAGEKSRPDNKAVAPGQLVSLDELMKLADYSEEELGLLRQSAVLSDELSAREIEAMNAVYGLFPDGEGKYSIQGTPDKTKAIELIFSQEYEQKVSEIMAPLTLFRQRLAERLNNIVSLANAQHSRAIYMMWVIFIAVMGLFVVFLLLVAVVIVRPILLCDMFAKQVAGGNYDSRINYTSSNEIGSLAESLRLMLQSMLKRINLEESIRYFDAIISSVDTGVIIKDKDGLIKDWNAGAECILGYKPDEIIGRTTKYYAPKEGHAALDEIAARLQKGEHTVHVEVVRRHKDGRLIDCSASYTPIFNNNGKYDGSVAIFHDITQKKSAEQKAHKFAAIISIADAGIIVKDKEGIVLEWNIGAENILGYKPDEIIGYSTKHYAPEEGHAAIDEIEARLKEGEHTAHVEVVRKHKDGRLINCSASYTPIFNDNGKYDGSVAIFHDITQKKWAEQKAHKFAAIIAIADAGIIVKNKEGIVLEWNIGAENILGYKPDEIIGHSTKYYAPEEGHADIDAIEERLAKGEHIAHVEVVRKHKDGRLIDCSASYTPIYDDNGRFTGTVAIFHDVTVEKNAVNKVKHMAAIVSAADAGIVIKDTEYNILEWNLGAENILGYKAEEIIGKNTNYYVPKEDYAEIDELKERLRRGEHTVHAEVVRKHKDGRLVDCSATFTPVFDDKRRYIGSVTVFQDISEKKQMEYALKEAARSAEEASKAKSSFLANMSHEIRTPMNGVIGFAELALDDGELTDGVRDYLKKIKSSATNLLDIINDILDISKIETGAMQLEKIPFSLHDVFNECEYINKPKAEEKGVSLYFYAEPFIGGQLLGDPTKLRQALLNLLSNAIKFTHLGIVKLTAALVEEKDNTVKINFEVRDSGIGMTSEQIEKIFDPFAQADSSTTRMYGGTGLGLSITKGFVEMMGGQLHVDSNPGLGSKFSFTLVFETISETAMEEYRKKEFLSVQNKPAFMGEVLVCEDNSINQEVIVKHLSKVGLSSVLAPNGKLGLEEVKKRMNAGKPFDLILMDIHMPVMDGLEATRLLLDMGCKTPIIALTANAMSTDKESYLAQGMSDYLSKPFTAEEMWICLARNLTPMDYGLSLGAAETKPDTRKSTNSILNEKEGIEISAGDAQLYRRVQSNFYHDNLDVMIRLNEAIHTGDIELAHRTAHTLKGTAALIGAEKLAQAASVVEKTLLTGIPQNVPEQMKLLESALREVLAVLEPVSLETESAEDLEIFDKDIAIALIETVSPLLESGNPESVGFINEIKLVLKPLGDVCDKLLKQIEDFDFDMAYETIQEIRGSLGE